jgi:homopolymeric O-antigen transport system permease protein
MTTARPGIAQTQLEGRESMGEATSRPATHVDMWGMLWTLVRTDFKSRYHGTLGGFVWALLKPATMFLVLMAVFSLVFSGTPHYRLYLIVGLFLWDFFTEASKTGLVSLQAKGFLLTKARFPSWILVVASLSNAVITLGVFATTFVFYLIVAGRAPSVAGLALFLLYLALFFLIVVGFSLGSSILFLRYRDLNQVWEVVTQAGFFIAPIIYPLNIIPERYHIYLYLWPPTPVIQFSRAVLLGEAMPTLKAHLLLVAMTAAVLAAGAAIFRAHSPNAAENL